MKLYDYLLIIILFWLCIFLTPARAECSSGWTADDTRRELLYDIGHTLDYFQTQEIAHNPNYSETNPILGRQPGSQEVTQYFLITGIGHYAVSCILANKYRRIFQNTTIIIQWSFVFYNINQGISIRIPF